MKLGIRYDKFFFFPMHMRRSCTPWIGIRILSMGLGHWISSEFYTQTWRGILKRNVRIHFRRVRKLAPWFLFFFCGSLRPSVRWNDGTHLKIFVCRLYPQQNGVVSISRNLSMDFVHQMATNLIIHLRNSHFHLKIVFHKFTISWCFQKKCFVPFLLSSMWRNCSCTLSSFFFVSPWH